MKAELQDVMDMLRKLQGSIDFGATPATEREELAGDVSDIMDALFEAMKKLPVWKEGPQQEQPRSLHRALALAQGHGQQDEIGQDQEGCEFHGGDYRVERGPLSP